MTDLDSKLRALFENTHGADIEAWSLDRSYVEKRVMPMLRAAADLALREMRAVAIKFTADLVRMGCENNCPGDREHIDREQVVVRAMRFKHDIDALRTRGGSTP